MIYITSSIHLIFIYYNNNYNSTEFIIRSLLTLNLFNLNIIINTIITLFTKEFKPSLRFCVSQDLVDARESLIGVVHTAFSLNMKVRELLATRLKNHPSTTTSHVRFVMKMAKSNKKGDDRVVEVTSALDKLKLDHSSLKNEHAQLKKQNEDLVKSLKRLESRIDSHIALYNKGKKGDGNDQNPSKKGGT